MAGVSVGFLNFKVGVNTDAFSKGLKKIERRAARLSKSMKKTGRALTTNLTLPLVAFGAAGLKAFDEQQKAIAQVEAGLKSTANVAGFTSKELQKMASDLQKTSLFGDEDILKNATAQLLTFTNITGEQFAKTQELALDLATRLDGDLKSSSIMLGKALNDPVANLSALSRAGIQFSVDQKEVINSLVETGNLAEAQTIILEELEKQYGGSAEAARNAGLGPVQALGNTFSDLSEQIGARLLPVVQNFAEFLVNLMEKFDKLDEGTKDTIVTLGLVLAIIGPVILIVAQLVSAFIAITRAIRIARIAMIKFNAVLVANPVGVIVLAIIAFITILVILYNNVEEVRGVLHGLFKAAVKIFTGLKDLVMDSLGGVGDILVGIFTLDIDKITEGFRKSGKAFKDYGSGIVDEFKAGYKEGIEAEPLDFSEILGMTEEDAPEVDVTGNVTDLKTDDLENIEVTTPTTTTSTEPTKSPFEVDIDALKRNHKEAIIAEKENLLNGLITKEEFNQRIREEELGHLEQMKMVNEQYGKDVLDLEEKIVDAKQNIFDNTEVREFEGALGSLGDKMAEFFDVDLKTLEDGMMGILTKLGDELAQGADSFEEYAQNVKGMLKDVIGGLISQGVTAAITNALTSTSFLPPFLIPVVAGAAAGLARTAFNSLIPAFAEGGLVTGPTLGLIGEGIGTNASNPEVIAPLDKLKGFMNGGDRVVVEGVIKGNDIFLSNQRTKQSRFRTI